MKRGKKTPLKKSQDELWELCKLITRQRYQKSDGTWDCFTCGRPITDPGKAQTGHCIPSSVGGALLRYNLDNLRIQDYFCNINAGGNGAVFITNLRREIGDERVDAMLSLRGQTVKADIIWYRIKIDEYKKLFTGYPLQ